MTYSKKSRNHHRRRNTRWQLNRRIRLDKPRPKRRWRMPIDIIFSHLEERLYINLCASQYYIRILARRDQIPVQSTKTVYSRACEFRGRVVVVLRVVFVPIEHLDKMNRESKIVDLRALHGGLLMICENGAGEREVAKGCA